MTKKQVFYYVSALAVITIAVYLYTSDVMAPPDNSSPDRNVFVPSTSEATTPETDLEVGDNTEILETEEVTTAANNNLSSTAWRWLRTEDSTGAILIEPAAKPFVLSFGATDSMGSQTDCNTLGGEFLVEGNSLAFDKMLSTKMFCEDSLEEDYAAQLLKVSDYVLADNMLKLGLTDDSGTMFFVRVDN